MAYLLLALQLAPYALQLGESIESYVSKIIANHSKPGGPTAADWAALAVIEDKYRAILNDKSKDVA